MTVLVLGFGPFGEVSDNPARRLALFADGRGTGVRIVGREMPVSYVRCLAVTLEAVAEVRPDVVLGIGVGRSRMGPEVELLARRAVSEHPDVDGLRGVLEGPDTLPSTLDLADALGCERSTDAGTYVCNGWLYQALRHLTVPVGFLHVPPAGMDARRLVAALDTLRPPPSPRVG
ncbi:MAG: hypothetical protein KC656_12860 [Myxococcales bacterium]|nr:hypothetical protein [Myxococcales bacterium]MCB9668620.1 hypothetical protein [Alphaproteobacteria bacterium]MCB9690860.1 hypothetical protein [Alphaproteobacteria bacterium]